MKTCTVCQQTKDAQEFYKHKTGKSGLTAACKPCTINRGKLAIQKSGYKRPPPTEAQKQATRDRAKEWRLKNPERFLKNKAEWTANNADKMHQYKLDWQRRNRHKVHAQTMQRRARQINATPTWADQKAIEEIYGIARDLCVLTGDKWEVDHIVPLRAEKACGLHVQYNLQIVPQSVNRSKQNRYEIA